jgi:hypothetical protein
VRGRALGWTGFGMCVAFCVPVIPLIGAILLIAGLVRGFRPRWVGVVGLVIGLGSTALQVAVVTSDSFWDGFRDGLNNSIEDQTDQARESGEATEIPPFKLREGDCINDAAVKTTSDQVETQSVVLLPCDEPHDIEVYALFEVPGDDYPGQAAIDRVARKCFPAFRDFVGTAYADSVFEIYYYFPTSRSWRFLDDRTVTCGAGNPKKRVTGSLAGAKR